MARWLAILATLPLTGCFNGVLLRPVHVDGPVAETTVTAADHSLCRSKIAIIDVEGMILNMRSTSLLNKVTLYRKPWLGSGCG